MGKFNCQFPGCTFTTDESWQIHSHHIKPRELNGEDKPYNLVDLCPTHHNMIYIPEAKSGQHSHKSKNSIEIIRWIGSTDGRLLEYKSVSGTVEYHKPVK